MDSSGIRSGKGRPDVERERYGMTKSSNSKRRKSLFYASSLEKAPLLYTLHRPASTYAWRSLSPCFRHVLQYRLHHGIVGSYVENDNLALLAEGLDYRKASNQACRSSARRSCDSLLCCRTEKEPPKFCQIEGKRRLSVSDDAARRFVRGKMEIGRVLECEDCACGMDLIALEMRATHRPILRKTADV